jgi:nucleoside-diphosphate-sugar epimerase
MAKDSEHLSLKTLLTGASSRFGSYLIDELTRNGDSVIAAGDFACGYPPNRERTEYLDTKMDSETILNLATDFDRIIHLPVSAGGPSQLLSSQAIVESTESH